MSRSAAASVPMSHTGNAEAHIRAGRSVPVTRSGKVVAIITPIRRTMTYEEEVQRMAPFADLMAAESLGVIADQDEP